MRTRPSLIWLLASLLLVGCPKDDKKSDEKSSKEDKADKDDDKGKKKKKGDDDDKGDDKDKKKKGDDEKDDKPAKKDPPKDIPMPERTKVPTKAEFDGAPDAKVAGNDIGCEVRTVREWIRVSCRKKSPSGGSPTALWVTRGRTKETYLFSAAGVTSMVTPYLPGTDVEAKYSWSDVVYTVQVRWLKGQEKPETLVHFAKSDEKPVDVVTIGATCECYKKSNPGKKCDDSNPDYVATNPWCEQSFGTDCQKLVECARGEPGRMPTCPKGTLVMYPGNYCAKECTSSTACAKGESCVDHPYGVPKKICMVE